jgi:hypothetical protein
VAFTKSKHLEQKKVPKAVTIKTISSCKNHPIVWNDLIKDALDFERGVSDACNSISK